MSDDNNDELPNYIFLRWTLTKLPPGEKNSTDYALRQINEINARLYPDAHIDALDSAQHPDPYARYQQRRKDDSHEPWSIKRLVASAHAVASRYKKSLEAMGLRADPQLQKDLDRLLEADYMTLVGLELSEVTGERDKAKEDLDSLERAMNEAASSAESARDVLDIALKNYLKTNR